MASPHGFLLSWLESYLLGPRVLVPIHRGPPWPAGWLHN